jgi:hypothetical protein
MSTLASKPKEEGPGPAEPGTGPKPEWLEALEKRGADMARLEEETRRSSSSYNPDCIILHDVPKKCWYCHQACLKNLKCGKCKNVRYCGKECQKQHWKQHHRSNCFASSELKQSQKDLTWIDGTTHDPSRPQGEWAPWKSVWKQYMRLVKSDKIHPLALVVCDGPIRDPNNDYQSMHDPFFHALAICERKQPGSFSLKHFQLAVEWGHHSQRSFQNYMRMGLPTSGSLAPASFSSAIQECAQWAVEYDVHPIKWTRTIPVKWWPFFLANRVPWVQIYHLQAWQKEWGDCMVAEKKSNPSSFSSSSLACRVPENMMRILFDYMVKEQKTWSQLQKYMCYARPPGMVTEKELREHMEQTNEAAKKRLTELAEARGDKGILDLLSK